VCSVLWTPSTKRSRSARSLSAGSKAMLSPETPPSPWMSRTTRPLTSIDSPLIAHSGSNRLRTTSKGPSNWTATPAGAPIRARGR